jgi:hypothetical protein
MIEAIQLAALDAAKIPASAPGVSSPQATPWEMSQFANVYQQAGASQGAVQAQAVQPAGADGSRVLMSALDRLNQGAGNIEDLTKAISTTGGDFTPGQMMDMTMRCHQFMFTTELTANVANRTSDGVQQLFRQQS